MKVRYSARAIGDLIGIADYLSERSPAGSRAVKLSIRRTIELIALFPHGGRVLEQRPTIRVMPIARYPYLVFYTVQAEEIVILRVRHGARSRSIQPSFDAASCSLRCHTVAPIRTLRILPSPKRERQPMLPDLPHTEIAIVEMTNAFRKENRLDAVKPNAALAAAARAFAHYLAKTGKFAHEADGREPHERAMEYGYRYCLVAENLALNLDSRGFETRVLAGDVVEGWKKSPGHRQNLLQRSATEIGVAVVRAPHKHPKFISVQLFGRPETLKVEFSIENRASAAIDYALGEETHTLPSRATVTHTSCDPDELTFEKAGSPAGRFDPRNGDRFVIRAGGGGAVEVKVERK